jgi:hypothetical protein
MIDIRHFIKNNHQGDQVSDGAILQLFFDTMASRKTSSIAVAPASGKMSKNMDELNLGGRQFTVSQPIRIRGLHGAIIANGAIEAAGDFPEGGYLFDVQEVNTLKIENVLFECNKRANGIYAHKFLRLRIEDCTITHQKDFGIYGNDTGYNHELEVVKCNIIEYLWGDGVASNTKGRLPDFRLAANRTSTGVFLGQADNVVADCNINLCRVGIRVGMRANRIQGNHITAGGTLENEIFDGIILDKHVKSSCLIVNNYIDNCRVVLNVDDNPVNARNYVTITDNLFYKGFNHPNDGREFNHIIVRPLAKNSLLQNVIIANNQFYNQDEHLDGGQERVILPIAVESKSPEGLDADRIAGSVVKGNVFCNAPPYYEKPVGTSVTIVTDPPAAPAKEVEVDFSEYLVWGEIKSCGVTPLDDGAGAEPAPFVARMDRKKVIVRTKEESCARYSITVDVNTGYLRTKATVN